MGVYYKHTLILEKEDEIIYLAHICLENGERKEQTLKEHCYNVALYTSEKLKSMGFSNLGYITGLVHDMGKYSDVFSAYIEAAFRGEKVVRGSVNHTFAAVIYLMERYHVGRKRGYDTMACEIIAYAAGAHHGEFDVVTTEGKSGFEHRLEIDRDELEYNSVVERFLSECVTKEELDDLFTEATNEVRQLFERLHKLVDVGVYKQQKCDFLLGMVARMVLSAIINADRVDTAEFMNGTSYSGPQITKEIWQKELNYMEGKMANFHNDTPINEIRSIISKQCLNSADRGNGIYRISVPTGAGKTLSTLRYALALAKNTGKEHIIFIIPLLSVLDQNSKVIREYISDENLILEHHSNVVHVKEGNELDQYELLTDTWDAPIIISTLYQFLMNLFSDKTTAIRRMQSLCNSVIVLDEAQSLPFKLTYQFNMAVNFLKTFCNTTIVLSSATQPCFEKAKIPIWFSNNADLVVLSEKMKQIFKRTKINNLITPEGMNMSELQAFTISLLDNNRSILTICNTKKTAKTLYEKLKLCNSDDEYELFHLSTLMCTKHRLDTIRDIKECLESGRRMICIATQLVEAGIDFSFESVIRIYAGMDNIAQAAGRCNRSYDYGHICNVYLVKLREENLSRLKDIQIAQTCTQNLLFAYDENPNRFKGDLLSEESLRFYYEGLFNVLEKDNKLDCPVKNRVGEDETLFDLLSSNKKYTNRKQYTGKFFLQQAFKTAGSLFSVFETKTTDVLVPYNEEASELISDLFSEQAQYDRQFTKQCLTKLKQYTIQIWDYQKERLVEDGLIYSDPSGHIYALLAQCYNNETGLDEEKFMF